MTVSINPKTYNLSSKTKLQKSPKGIFIVIERKSRIIMKDGYRILSDVKKIKEFEPGKKINVLSSAPVCSKTKHFLHKNGVSVENV